MRPLPQISVTMTGPLSGIETHHEHPYDFYAISCNNDRPAFQGDNKMAFIVYNNDCPLSRALRSRTYL